MNQEKKNAWAIQWTLSISNSQGTNKFVQDRESSR